MAETIDEILATVIETKTDMKNLKDRLYDCDGDILAIKEKLNNLNGKTQDQEGRLVIIETKLVLNNSHRKPTKKQITIGSSVTMVTALIYGLGKVCGWW